MIRIPDALRTEHERLHAQLGAATRLFGRTGEAARTVAKIMHPHFLREDECATPPLGLVPRLAGGHVSPDMAEVLPLVARLADELPLMLEEHRAIAGALAQLAEVATSEGQPAYAELAEELQVQAQLEEAVLYPAALLVGAHVKSHLRGKEVS